jgi:hypothetical protein
MNAKIFVFIVLTTVSIVVFAPIAKAGFTSNGLSANGLTTNGLSLHKLFNSRSMPSTGMSLSSSQFQSIRVQDGHLIGTP